jgi:hypothetical protein
MFHVRIKCLQERVNREMANRKVAASMIICNSQLQNRILRPLDLRFPIGAYDCGRLESLKGEAHLLKRPSKSLVRTQGHAFHGGIC